MYSGSEKNQELVVARLKSGSKGAFREIFDFYGPKIYAFAFSYLKNEADAEELLQDVFLKLWEVRESLDESKDIKSFIFKICINLIYDLIRRKNVEKAYLEFSANNYMPYTENLWEEVIYNDMVRNLQALISQMPSQRQHIFRLSKEKGLTNEEITRELNLSKRTVENQLYRALAFLKQKIGSGSMPAILFFFLHCN